MKIEKTPSRLVGQMLYCHMQSVGQSIDLSKFVAKIREVMDARKWSACQAACAIAIEASDDKTEDKEVSDFCIRSTLAAAIEIHSSTNTFDIVEECRSFMESA